MDVLEDVFYSYTGDATSNINDRAEFAAMPTTMGSVRPQPGQFYPYQNQFAMAMQFLRKAVCIYEPGTGKTKTYTAASAMLRMATSAIDDKVTALPYAEQYTTTGKLNIKKVVILTLNKKLVRDIQSELNAYYASKKISKFDIESYYYITTHKTFAGEYSKLFKTKYDTDTNVGNPYTQFADYLAAQFSDTMFVFDESGQIAGQELSKIDMELLRKGRNYDGRPARSPLMNMYNMIHFIAHAGTNTIRTAFTGTPIANSVAEFATTFNLVLDANEQIDVDDNISHFKSWSTEEFDKYFSNIIFYIEQPKDNINVIYHGEDVPELGYKVEDVGIGVDTIQEDDYMYASILDKSTKSEVYDENVTESKGKAKGKTSGSINRLFAAQMGFTGDEHNLIEQYATSTKKEPHITSLADNERMIKLLGNDRELRSRSIKEYKFRQLVRSNPKTKIGRYDQYVETSGIMDARLNLKAMGYEEYVSDDVSLSALGKVISGEKRKRYVYVDKTWNADAYSRALNVWACEDNLDGGYIHVFLASPLTRVGISVLNTPIIVVCTPQWNKAAFTQIINRFIRVGGYDTMMRVYGLTSIDVHVHLWVSYLEREDWSEFAEADIPTINGEIITIDEHRINTAAAKQPEIDRFLYAMISRAITGKFNVQRNTTAIGPYGVPTFPPLISPDKLYTNTFYNLYLGNYIEVIQLHITNYMQTHNVLTVDELILQTRSYHYPLRVYNEAILKLVKSNAFVKNRYGITKYIRYDRNAIYLSDDYLNSQSDFFDSYYSAFIPINVISHVEEGYTLENEDITILLSYGDDYSKIMDYLINTRSSRNAKHHIIPNGMLQRSVLEDAIVNYYIKNDERYKYIIEFFDLYIYSQAIGNTELYYHSLMVTKTYTITTSIINPNTFRLYKNDKWVTIDSKSNYYKEMKDFVTDKLPKRLGDHTASGEPNFPLEAPIMFYAIMDNNTRIARAPGIVTVGVSEKKAGDNRYILRGSICTELGKNDLLTTIYQLDSKRRPPVQWKTGTDVVLDEASVLMHVVYDNIKYNNLRDYINSFDKYQADDAVFIYNWMVYYLDNVNVKRKTIKQILNDNQEPSGIYQDVSYIVRNVTNEIMKLDTTRDRQNTYGIITHGKSPEIISQYNYMLFMYNWYKYITVPRSMSIKKLCDVVEEIARSLNKYYIF